MHENTSNREGVTSVAIGGAAPPPQPPCCLEGGLKYEPWVRTLEGKFRTRDRKWSFRTPGWNIEFPNPGFRNSVYVRTLGSNSFSFEVQPRFNSSSRSLELSSTWSST